MQAKEDEIKFSSLEEALNFYRKTPNRQKSFNLIETEASSITQSQRLESELVYTVLAKTIEKLSSSTKTYYGRKLIDIFVIERATDLDSLCKHFGCKKRKARQVINDFLDELEDELIAVGVLEYQS